MSDMIRVKGFEAPKTKSKTKRHFEIKFPLVAQGIKWMAQGRRLLEGGEGGSAWGGGGGG